MFNFILSAEAACDLPQDLIDCYSISIAPMTYFINNNEYNTKTSSLTTKDICLMMQNGATTKTTQLNEQEVETYLQELLKEGKDILHISFSSAMSGTYNNFKKVAESLNKTNTNKIYVVDSLCQSFGDGLILTEIAKKSIENNFSAAEAQQYAESIKLSIGHFFIVDNLKYLARGGRISSSVALIGNLLNLKPVLHLDNNGVIVQLTKVIGRKKSILTLIENFKNNYNGNSKDVYISHADCMADATFLKEKLLALNPNLNIVISDLGPIIVSHAGPGTMALFFTSNKR